MRKRAKPSRMASLPVAKCSSSSEVDAGAAPDSRMPIRARVSDAENTSQPGTASSAQSAGQPSRPPPMRAPSKRIVSGQSKTSGFTGGETAPMASASAAMPAKKTRRARASGSSGSSTKANSRTSNRPTWTRVPAPASGAIRQACAKASPVSRRVTSV